MAKICVLGIGNILLTDDGFGVRVIEQLLNHYHFPDHVAVLDGGTLGMNLLRFLAGTEKLIVVDVIHGGDRPGVCYKLCGDAVKAYRKMVSMHELGIFEVLRTLELLGKPVREVVILGVEPALLEAGLELSPPVAARVETIVQSVVDQLQLWQVEVKRL